MLSRRGTAATLTLPTDAAFCSQQRPWCGEWSKPLWISCVLWLSLSGLPVAPRLPEIDSALQTLSEILQQLTNQKSSIEDDIHTTFDELQKTLNVRKSVLLMELEVNYGLKQKVKPSLKWHIQRRGSMSGLDAWSMDFGPMYLITEDCSSEISLTNLGGIHS